MEPNGAISGQHTATEGGAEATPEDGSELQSDHPSASNKTRAISDGTYGRGRGSQRNSCWQLKFPLSLLQHPSKMKDLIQRNTHTGCARREQKRLGWYQKEKELEKIQIRSQKR